MSSPSEVSPSEGDSPISVVTTPPSPPFPVAPHGEDEASIAPTPIVAEVSAPCPPTLCEEALSNQDILTLTFETLLPPTSHPPDKATRRLLHTLALLCRSFSGPALDCLWKVLDSLLPLIRLLEPYVFVVDGAYYPSGSIYGLGDTFKKYASRVRSLHIVGGATTVAPIRVDSSVYLFLTQFLGGNPLLPGLKTFLFESVDDLSFSWHTLPILFPCVSLSDVILKGPVFENALSRQTTLPLIVARAPRLKLLAIDTKPCGIPLLYKSLFEQGIFRLRHLQTLDCALRVTGGATLWLPRTFLTELGRALPHLEQLKLDLRLPNRMRIKMPKRVESPAGQVSGSTSQGQVVYVYPIPQKFDQDLFPRLHCLELVHQCELDFTRCETVSSLIYNVVSLALTLRQSWMAHSFSCVVDELARCPQLRALTLKGALVAVSADDIVLLLARLNLDQLDLEAVGFTSHPGLEDEDGLPVIVSSTATESAGGSLERILKAASRPQESGKTLRSLTLPQTWGDRGDAGLALLADIRRKAHQMEYLGISLDSSLTTSNLSYLPSPIVNVPNISALKYLQLRDYRTGDQPFTPAEYKAIAQYLDMCFPNLISLGIHPSSNVCAVDHWAHVEHLRAMYQGIRRLSSAPRHRV